MHGSWGEPEKREHVGVGVNRADAQEVKATVWAAHDNLHGVMKQLANSKADYLMSAILFDIALTFCAIVGIAFLAVRLCL